MPKVGVPSMRKMSRPGFRLDKLEVLNWGTFDREIYSMRLAGQSTLLVGQNGSGKSTLVDAILTLLVRPGSRNFNVAAGAKKKERDERTYIRGAYDRGSSDVGSSAPIKYLRPKGNEVSIILGCFRNEETNSFVTVAQVLYLDSDQQPEKVYCYSEDERSIKKDFHGIKSTKGLLKLLDSRGMRVSKKYGDFEGWLNKAFRLKTKAMEVFNQTVAVKDIHCLNEFIRDRMLERQNWDERVDSLLVHFSQLTEAHGVLIRARQQLELLEPIALQGEEYRRLDELRRKQTSKQSALSTYFNLREIALFEPEINRLKKDLQKASEDKGIFTREIEATDNAIRTLQNDIENSGGERLKQIPTLISQERSELDRRTSAYGTYMGLLEELSLVPKKVTESTFLATNMKSPMLLAEVAQTLDKEMFQRDEYSRRQHETQKSLRSLKEELASLGERHDNMPPWCIELRKTIAGSVGLKPRDLPFAAELIQVRREERDWEASIEKVLRGLSLSLLVPERHYAQISRFLEKNKLIAQGRGQRLSYVRVAGTPQAVESLSDKGTTLVSKLQFRDGNPLLPWLKNEIRTKFDFVCCETIAQFQSERGNALTKNRHLKRNNQRHEKDDREHISDPRNFVLGWDNQEKKQLISSQIAFQENELSSVGQQLEHSNNQITLLNGRKYALTRLQEFVTFESIDFDACEQTIAKLEAEKRSLISGSKKLRTLEKSLLEAQSSKTELQQKRDNAVSREGVVQDQITRFQERVSQANDELAKARKSGHLKLHELDHAEIENDLDSRELTVDSFERIKGEYWQKLTASIQALEKKINPVQTQLLTAMGTYLRKFPEGSADLQSNVDNLESFLGLRARIIDEDLPRHEKRFKDRLNQKVIEEIGLFRGSLEHERKAIEQKIDSLNIALKRLEYRKDGHIQLEPRPIKDAEIADFQKKLRDCIDGNFEDSPEADEARFCRIQELIVKLEDDTNRTWRSKVTDVRKWFDFVAKVIDRKQDAVVSEYQNTDGQSGGEKAKLAFTILVAAIAYQYDLDPESTNSDKFHFVVVDEMFSKVDDQHAEYALKLFQQFGLQLLIVAPLDSKARITQPYVGSYSHVVKKDNRSNIFHMTTAEFEGSVVKPSKIESMR